MSYSIYKIDIKLIEDNILNTFLEGDLELAPYIYKHHITKTLYLILGKDKFIDDVIFNRIKNYFNDNSFKTYSLNFTISNIELLIKDKKDRQCEIIQYGKIINKKLISILDKI